MIRRGIRKVNMRLVGEVSSSQTREQKTIPTLGYYVPQCDNDRMQELALVQTERGMSIW